MNAERFEALYQRARREPLEVDLSDFSDEYVAGFLGGQANMMEVLEPADAISLEIDARFPQIAADLAGRFSGSPESMSAAREAICAAAGWEYCAEHDKPRYDGSNPCAHLHRSVAVTHDQACSWPNDDCICGAFDGRVSSQEADQ